ncbi:MAG: regulatory protein RecX [Leeuwenhoekiella sp.]
MPKHKTYTVEEAKRKLERFCAYQDRCHQEAVEQLRQMRMIPEAIDVIVVHLINENFLDEERFARSFARGKFRIKKWGKKRIILELRRKGIHKNLIEKALTEIDDVAYYQTFETLAKKRFNQLTAEKKIQAKRKKFADYLLYRGWPSTWVYDKAKELIPYK